MIVKIPTVNDTYTGHCTKCAPVEGKFGPQVCYTFANGDQLYMPIKSAKLQLLRCGFDDGDKDDPKVDYPAVANNTLFFSRTANRSDPAAAPYYNVEIATGGAPAPSKRLTEVPGVAPTARTPATQSTTTSAMSKTLTTPPTRSRQQVADAYAWCLTTATAAQTAAFPKPTPDSIQAGAATLLIQLERSGLLFEPITLATVAKALDLTPPSQFEEPLPEYEEDNLPF